MKKIIKVEQVDLVTHITWMINNICPNKCSYCPPINYSGSNHKYIWDNARQVAEMILLRYPTIHLSIAGGEPTMSPFLLELVKMFNAKGHYISLTTNGSKSADYWEELAPLLSHVSFSYHPEFETERYFENLKTASKFTRCGTRVMMLSSHWDQCVSVYEKLKYGQGYPDATPVRIVDWGNHNGTDYYTEEQLAWLSDPVHNIPPNKKLPVRDINNNKHIKPDASTYYFDDGTQQTMSNASLFVNSGQTNFKGYSCDIGLRSLYIGADGRIRRGNCTAGGIIGHLDNPAEIMWPSNSIVCPHTLCSCSTDVIINKRSLDPVYRDITANHAKVVINKTQNIRQRLGHKVVLN